MRCGVVKEQISTNEGYTHKGSTDVKHHRYLAVLYDDGVYEDTQVTADTYFKHPPGKRICFIKEISFTIVHEITFLITAIFSLIIAFASIIMAIGTIANICTTKRRFDFVTKLF